MIHETVVDSIPRILDNAASQRHAVITTLGSQYVRYRQAGCSPSQSRIQAIKQTASARNVGKSAVYEHIRALPIEGIDRESTLITNHLETVYSDYQEALPAAVRVLKKPYQKLVRVLSAIAEIDETPGLMPSDLTIQEVKRDRPGKTERVLTAEHDVVGLVQPGEDALGASVRDSEIVSRGNLEDISSDGPTHFTDAAAINTRDIATYDTAYSRVIRKIFEAVQAEMRLEGKQKPGPIITTSGDDNAAVRAVLPHPESSKSSPRVFARLDVRYWRRGGSDVRVTTHPLDRVYDEDDPSLSGPIDAISTPGIHTLVGKTMVVAKQAAMPSYAGCS